MVFFIGSRGHDGRSLEDLSIRMHVYLINVDIRLPGCRSLKDKRSRVSGAKKRLGRESHLAIAEVDTHDQHGLSSWQVVLIAPDQALFSKRREALEKEFRCQ